jgi:integrase
LTVSDALDLYLETRGKEIASLERALAAAKHLKAYFGATWITDTDLPVQEGYVAKRLAAGAKNETIKRELGVLSAAFRWVKPRKRLQYVPDVMSLPSSPPKDRWLSRDEAARILRHFRAKERRKRCAHLALFTRLALFTGARSGAILELTWDRVDLQRRRIKYGVTGAKLTNKGRAVITIEDNMVRALRHTKRHTNSEYVITSRGEKCDRIVRGFRANMKELGLDDVTPHTLRHTFATWAALKGEPLFLIGKALGQSVARTTERYAQHQPEALRSVTNAVRRK